MPVLQPHGAPLLLAAALAFCGGAQSQEFRPGLWEITVPNAPKPQMMCFTPDMKKDPKVEMQKHGVDCKKSDETVSGDTQTYYVTCKAPNRGLNQTSRVTVVTHSPDHLTITTDYMVETGGKTVSGKSSLVYRRVGDCK